ncbi:MAG: NAD(P)H-dependent oxidoreductase [Microvirga sp.]|nr:NAD(P)H-dependent oxidoreductase [Microvirga sp.]
MTRIVTIVGSPSRQSRTAKLARAVERHVAEATGAGAVTIEIAALVRDLGVAGRADASPAVIQALHAIESADLVIAASPVYKGSYTGLFKQLIDLVDYKALAGVPVALLAVGGSDRHALVVEHQLRPLFAFFGAATLPTAVFVSDALLADGADLAQLRDAPTQTRLDQLVSEAVDALSARIDLETSRPALSAA